MVRLGIPDVVVTDNDTQFVYKCCWKLMVGLSIGHRFVSVEYPQTNGQAEAVKKVVLRGLKRWLDEAMTNWVE